MKLFFDTEFTILNRDAELISIGIISDKGDTFYAEFNDYDASNLSDWLKENVIANLVGTRDADMYKTTINNHHVAIHNRSSKRIHSELVSWLRIILANSEDDDVEWISDVGQYDFMLLIDLMTDYKTCPNASALNYPREFGNTCYTDLNQMIAQYRNISCNQAFDLSREQLLEWDDITGDKHNALYDAKVIRQLYYQFKF